MNTIDDPTTLARQLRPIFQQYQVSRAILFGSLATGDASRRSDVDIIVILETDKRFLDRYDGILHDIAIAVSGRDVDLLIYTPAELEKMRDRPFIRQALKEGVTIYESEEKSLAGRTMASN